MEMTKLNKKTFFIILLSSSLVSCSTFDSLRFWQNDDDVDPDEPKELLSFNEQRNINIEWDISFNGVNDLGSFQPGFSSENLFFAFVNCCKLSCRKVDNDHHHSNHVTTRKLDQIQIVWSHT